MTLQVTLFLKVMIYSKKLAKMSTDDRYNNPRERTKFQSNSDIFDEDMTCLNFDIVLENFRMS